MFEIAVVNKPSVFEPLKFYCNNVRYSIKMILQDSRLDEYLMITMR